MSWGGYRPTVFGPRMGALGSQPPVTAGGYPYDVLQGLRGGTAPGGFGTPFAANGPGNIPFGAGGGWTPPPSPTLPSPPMAASRFGVPTGGGLRGAINRPSINAIAGPLIYGLGADMSQLGVDANNPLGRTLSSTLKNAGAATTFGGPVLGTGAGLFGGVAQAGAEVGKQSGQGSLGDKAKRSGIAGLIGSAGPVGQAFNLGKLGGELGIDPGAATDWLTSKLPGMGGGGESEAAAAPDQAQVEAQNRARTAMSPEGMTTLMVSYGVDPDYQRDLISQYNQSITLAKAQAEAGIPSEVPKLDKDGNPELDKDGNPVVQQVIPSDDQIRQSAYSQFLQALPAVAQQQQADAEFIRKTAAQQAAIAQFMPQVSAPGDMARGVAGQYLTQAIGSLPAGMQDTARAYANTSLAGSQDYANALTNSLALIPMRLQQDQQAAYNQQMSSQLQQALIQNQLAAQYPDLFTARNAGGSSGGGSLDDLLTPQ